MAFFGMGILNNVIPFCLIVWGQQHIASGLASILNATTPLFTVIVAHFLTADERPRTIHDFGGFPRKLFEQQYPAPGDPALARRAAGLIGAGDEALSTDWGLDHGTWTVLKYLLPDADVPVIQLSIDRRADSRSFGRRSMPSPNFASVAAPFTRMT